MILIIAEKPSLGRNIVASIGGMKKIGNYYEGSGYVVTWAFGHLFSLCDIEDYTGPTSTGRWSMENIPFFPKEFRFQLRKDASKQPDAGVKRQFELIAALCNREDVTTVVNAGDSDREGEIIIRLCVMNALKSEKKLTRLWLPDQTAQTIRKALGEMKEESAYDPLANEGFARTYIDWLYGVNLTRYATLKTGVLLRVGRVIVPIVKAVYDRDMSIKNFVPDIYYALVSREETRGQNIELTGKAKFEKSDLAKAEALCARYNGEKAVVTHKKTKKETLNPGKLYSLSKLQNILGKKFKMSMDDSLKLVQSLYEKGYLTYPRTNSEYLATAEKDKIKEIIAVLAKIGYPVVFKDQKTIFDDSKIESHSALTPTFKIPQKESLTEEEKKVYQTVIHRFVAVFCAKLCLAQKTEMQIEVGTLEAFTLKGTVILEPGWTKYDDYTTKDKVLPALEIGDEVNIHFVPKEKSTNPPKHYTIETLNNYLKNPFKEDKAAASESEEEDDAEDYKAIFDGLELGTEATRTGIIDNAKKSKYIDLKKDVYSILPDGIYLIESLLQMGISMDKYKTSALGQALKKVFHQEIGVKESVALAQKEIAEVFAEKVQTAETDTNNGFYGDEIGVCPLCGGKVVKGRYGYGCGEYKAGCKFRISGVICKRVISADHAKMLLESGRTCKIQGFISKTGKPFDAVLKMDAGKIVFDFQN
ncbi:MAG: DNA topoisomerase [Oscillospiraceae bacterium]